MRGYFNLSELSETVIDEADIAKAAASGVAQPAMAIGTAMKLYTVAIVKFSLIR